MTLEGQPIPSATSKERSMPRPLPTLVLWCALLALAACSAPQPPAAAAPGVGWVLVVLYNQPKDTAAFQKYYAETHVPLFFSHAQAIGFTRLAIIKLPPPADSKPPPLSPQAN